VYNFDSEAQITGRLTLIGGTYDVFVFQIASTLITSALSEVYLDGDAQASNVFWQVGSSATLGADSMMTGRVLAQISITAGDQVIVDEGLVALTGAITLQYGFVEGIAECDRNPGLPPPPGITTSSTTISTFSITSTSSSNVPVPSVSAPTIGGGSSVGGVSSNDPTIPGNPSLPPSSSTIQSPTMGPPTSDG